MRRRSTTTFLVVILAALGTSLASADTALAGTTSIFNPVADAYVTKVRPSRNFGASRDLLLDARPTARSYVRFAVRGLDGPVGRATLYVYVKRGSGQTVRVWSVRNRAWRENAITYSNAPALVRAVGGAKNVRGGWKAIDVTGGVTDEGQVTLALATTSATELRLASRETMLRPRLAVESDLSAPTVAITNPASGSSFTAPQTVDVTALATDDVRVKRVEFWHNGTRVKRDSTAPFSYAWSVKSSINGPHTWTAKAFDWAGRSATSAPVDVTVAVGDASAPTAPTSLLATSTTETSVSLSWQASTDDVGVAGYRIYVGATAAATTSVTSYTASDLACGTSYMFGVEAYDAAGNVSPRTNVTAGTSACGGSGTTYYVDGLGGNDANAGTTPSSPWKTLAKASSAVLAPGDQLLLKRGVSWTGSLKIAESGTLANPISIGAYGVGEMPVITGSSSCVVLAGSYLVVRNLHADNCSWAGFDVSGNRSRVESNMSTNNVAGVDVRAGATGNAVVGNTIKNNNKMSVLTASPSNDDSGAFGIALHGDGTEVAYNTISGSDAFSYDYGRDGAAVEIYGGKNNSVHHNLAVDNNMFTELGDPRAADNTYTANVVRSSLATSTFLVTRGAATAFGPVLRTKVYNNTVYETGASSQGFVCYGGCSADVLIMRNNVVQAVWKTGYADAPFDENNNLFYGGITQFTLGAASLVANPQFVNPSAGDLHLVATSPAVDAGVDVGLSRDFDDVLIPQDGNGDGKAVPDMGAFERQASAGGGDTSPPTAPAAFQATGSTQTSISTSWTASGDNVGVTGYRLYRGASSVATTTGTSFTFTGLTCGSSYTLGVEAYDAVGNTSPRTTLSGTTVACSAGDFVLAAAGDVACAPPGTRGTTTCHQQATADLINSMNPAKVLMLGDAQYETGTLANFSAVYDPTWGAFKAKTLVTAGGSHDFYGGSEFFTYFGTTSMPGGAYKPYSYDLGNWHIVSLNSYCENANVGGCGTSGPQYTWLQEDLQTNAKPCILAMWHEPYWTSGYRHNNDTVTRPYVDLLYQHGADILLTAHEHAYERFHPQRPDGTRDDASGIRAFVVGTGGKSLETSWGTIEPNSAARQLDTYGVLKLSAHSSSYDWEFVPEAGKTYSDTGSASCH
jgi:chitodextrinase